MRQQNLDGRREIRPVRIDEAQLGDHRIRQLCLNGTWEATMSAVQQPASLSARDVLYEAACVACRAPSIANTQPWHWRIRDDTLELRADRSRQLTVADPQGRLMVLSCGAALHHATIVLAVLGATASMEHLDDPADPDLLARLTLQILKRWVDRCLVGVSP